ncbi:MMPL family transporter [Rhodococcus sp. IEGM 1401]|uniref:MMPL family transporter n=1 Tax=unclassified Rhodococcus (in: high G+C Gram-positive bacteria) TaxID=192944 RepID=UPI0022B5D6EB|nr:MULTISPECIES: MMPL family transporter [unclassified Rhodococcus (in: high G+C Gram-positive bacteria)]MCZ4562074.1 MMPL family transporter [Rhodococcus sp. IEGM 1401]MDI9922116.1 MMPL family transporter [Rhodococcus sp. IEGM 1372]MDV8034669.1 MMPL family transporter [Rhodococcus sp. IEGM 1414]
MTDTISRIDPQVTSGNIGDRWGRLVARRRWVVLAIWTLLAVGSAILYPALQNSLVGANFSVPGTESSRADDLIERHFESFGSEQLVVTFSSESVNTSDPAFRERVGEVVGQLRQSPDVLRVVDPYETAGFVPTISQDGTSALAFVGIGGEASDRIAVAERVQEMIGAASGDGVEVAVTGYSPMTVDLTRVESEDAVRAESIGLPIAFVVLVLALGSVVAGIVPLVSTGIGVLAAFGMFALLSNFMTFDVLVTTVAAMFGLGLGIDYALFIVSRFREEIGRAGPPDDPHRTERAVGAAMGTAGHTIVISGLVVLIALGALAIVDVPAVRSISLVVALTIATVVVVAWTLLPAILAVLGTRIGAWSLPRRFQPPSVDEHEAAVPTWWSRWAQHVIERPWRYTVASAAVLVVCLIPISSISYGVDLGAEALSAEPSGRANTVLTEKFAPGTISPITIVFTGEDDNPLGPQQLATVDAFAASVRDDDRVAYALAQPEGGRSLLIVVPSVPIDSTEAADLVGSLRAQAVAAGDTDGTSVSVGGTTALVVDASDEISGKFAWVVAAVLAFSLFYLAVVFRSVVIPLKAVAMNLLVTGAALGATVAVFQWGWGSSILGFESPGYIQVYLPVTVFAVVFGLSMDYEVFLIGRMREVFVRGASNDVAVVDGIEHTARPITAAAAIMIAVFASFLTADVLELKQFGFALAIAVLFDAVLVRMMMVPAMMKLFGERNWWPGSKRYEAVGS